MGNTWQGWVVLALVVLAAAYSVWYLLPARFRIMLGAVHRVLADKPKCGSCSSCGKCAAPSPVVHAAIVNGQPITLHRKR